MPYRTNRTKMRLKDKKITILGTRMEYDEWENPVEVKGPIPNGENIWAYVRHASGNEYYAAAQVQQKVEMVFEINWRDDIEPSMYILYKGKEYNITRIDDYEGYKDTLRIYAYTKDIDA
jgi:SPP1 family predicted phage head-tail adaptor